MTPRLSLRDQGIWHETRTPPKYEALITISNWVTDLHSMKRSPDLSFLVRDTSPNYYLISVAILIGLSGLKDEEP